MSDDLVYRIFVELAVLEGKRDVGGKWLIDDSSEMQRMLKRAFSMVLRASAAEEGEGRGQRGQARDAG